MSQLYGIDTIQKNQARRVLCFFAEIRESIGQLVPLGFDIAAFTPAAYQRRRLQRPLNEASS